MRRGPLLALGLILLAGLALLAHLLGGTERVHPGAAEAGAVPPPTVERPLGVTGPESCRPCHPGVYAEWEASFHRRAWTDPEVQQLSSNFQDKDCLPCHLPRPMIQTGLDARPLERSTGFEDGVDCDTCHRFGNAMLGPGPLGPEAEAAPCNPRVWAPQASMGLCAPCHDQHKVHEEWRQTRFAVEGPGFRDCNDCHMPVVQRPAGPAGPARAGRSHLFPAGHDREMLVGAGRLVAAAAADGNLLISVTNDGTGHNFPADERHRAVDLQVQLVMDDGRSALLRVDRFRNPYREDFDLRNPLREPGAERDYDLEAGDLGRVSVHAVRVPAAFNPVRTTKYPESTQIPAGEARSYVLHLPAGARQAIVRLWYRLSPYLPDEEAVLLHEQTVTF